jgi:integrase
VVRFLGYTTGKDPQTKSQETALAFMVSLRTGMRAGEVLQVNPASLSGRVVTLTDTKTEKRAQVPLTKQGHRLCSQCKGFTVSSGTLDALFRKARDATLVGDLRFHDARATALTHMARKMDVMTLARISRHRDLKILLNTYYRESADQIAARL